VIGGGDWARDRIVPDCIRAIRNKVPIPVRNKIATRPWQHVLEPLSGYLWLAAKLSSPEAKFPVSFSQLTSAFNFGPSLTSNRTVAELVIECLKHTDGDWTDESDPNALHEASKLNLATDKAFHLLQWQPVWDFEETIAKTAHWYVEEDQGQSPAHLTRSQIQFYQSDAARKFLPWAL
jgi:CDP-glucose 4,6-dehydratase